MFQILAFALLLALPQPPPSARVHDFADVLTAPQESGLEERLSGTQVHVITVDSLEGRAVGDYAQEVAEAWRLPRGAAVFLTAIKEHKTTIRTEPGTPLAESAEDLLYEHAVPHYKKGNYYGGIEAGVSQILGPVPSSFDWKLISFLIGLGLFSIPIVAYFWAMALTRSNLRDVSTYLDKIDDMKGLFLHESVIRAIDAQIQQFFTMEERVEGPFRNWWKWKRESEDLLGTVASTFFDVGNAARKEQKRKDAIEEAERKKRTALNQNVTVQNLFTTSKVTDATKRAEAQTQYDRAQAALANEDWHGAGSYLLLAMAQLSPPVEPDMYPAAASPSPTPSPSSYDHSPSPTVDFGGGGGGGGFSGGGDAGW